MNHTLNLSLTALVTAASLTLAPGAQAQSFGNYTGTTSQGQYVQITVGDDGSGGPAVTGALVFWDATCTKSGPGRGAAWGIGANQPIVGGQATVELRANALYEKFVLSFSGNQVTGSFLGHTAEFVDVNTSIKKVQMCDSGSLSLNASLTAAAAPRAALAAGQAVPLAR